jgi:pimeloyl-ACP methyl ester carboxylesterase
MAIGSVKNAPRVIPKAVQQQASVDVPEAKPPKQGWVAKFKQTVRSDVSALGFNAHAPLKPPPVLKRPVVMIPGLTMPASSYDPLARNLATNKQNGPVATYVAATGEFHYGGKNGRVMGDAELKDVKIFQMEYKDAKRPPTEKAPQIADMMSKIEAATGKHDVDVVTHSAGGTDFRQYLDTRGDDGMKFGKLVMIGPVTHGTSIGNVGSAVGGPLGLKDASDQLGIGDALVNHLDATWDKQRGQIGENVSIIGITGAPTLGKGGTIKTGDGYEQAADIKLPGADVTLLKGENPTPLAHLWEVGYSGVVDAVQDKLGQ